MKPGKTVLSAAITAITLTGTALTGIAIAAPAALATSGGATSPAFTNPGAASPSLSLSVSPAGEPEVASVGPAGTLWFRYMTGGIWHSHRVAGPGSAFSGPSIYAGPLGFTGIAVEGPVHTLQFYALAGGHWHHFVVTPPNTAYSAPSLAVGTTKAGISVEGPHHTLLCFSGTLSGLSGHLHHSVVNGPGTTFSAPSMVIRTADQATVADPAGEIDIAVENASHSLSYYRSRSHGWQNTVIGGPGSAYSAPSLTVLTSTFILEGEPYLVVQGPHHSLRAYTNNSGWQKILVIGNGRVYSAPSLTLGDTSQEAGMAFEGVSHSVSFVYWYVSGGSWVNDVITSISGHVNSAPALFFRAASGENDIVLQGGSNTLWYFSAPAPASPNLAPQFSGHRIGGPGTTFGG